MTLEALELVGEHQPVAVAELARLLNRPKSTAQRALLTLYEGGWIRPDGSDRTRWRLTTRVLTLASQVGNDTGLRDAARPVMERLRRDTAESISLCIRDGFETVSSDFLEGNHSIRYVTPTGVRVPLHAGASGKVILAYLPKPEIDDYLARGLAAFTDRTITNARSLRADLAKIREQGFAVSVGEVTLDAAGVAAPIFDHRGIPLASIAVTAPLHRLTKRRDVDRSARFVASAAGEITRRLDSTVSATA